MISTRTQITRTRTRTQGQGLKSQGQDNILRGSDVDKDSSHKDKDSSHKLKKLKLKSGFTCSSRPFKEASGTGANISQPLFSYSSCWELNLGLRNGSPMP